MFLMYVRIFFFKQKTAYEMRISDWSSDVCSSDLLAVVGAGARTNGDDFAFLRLFLGGVGDDDAASRLFFGFDTANKHAVVQRTKLHGYPSKSAMDVA